MTAMIDFDPFERAAYHLDERLARIRDSTGLAPRGTGGTQGDPAFRIDLPTLRGLVTPAENQKSLDRPEAIADHLGKVAATYDDAVRGTEVPLSDDGVDLALERILNDAARSIMAQGQVSNSVSQSLLFR